VLNVALDELQVPILSSVVKKGCAGAFSFADGAGGLAIRLITKLRPLQ